MSQEIEEIDIEALHEAIKDALKAKFPDCEVGFYNRHQVKMKVPAIEIELEGFDREPDTGTGQLEVKMSFSAKVFASYKRGNKMGVRLLAASVAKFVEGNRFGMPVTAAQFANAAPEEFGDEYEAWRVEWELTGALGESVWNPSGEPPREIHIGQARTVGTGFEPDYIKP